MSSELNNPALDANYLPDDDSIGGDRLWQENSEELGVKPPRVAYSSNPSSTAGIAVTAPPISAETSLFRWIDPQDISIGRTALQEGLRAVNLFATDTPTIREKQAEEVDQKPMITELAMQGLQWLIPQVKRGDPLRRAATRARAHLNPLLAAQTETRLQQARLRALDQVTAVHAVDTEDLRWENRQSGYQQALAAAIDGHAETAPGVYDYTALRTLSEELVLDESQDGPVIKERPRYQRKLDAIVNGCLEEPEQFYQSMRAATAVLAFAAESTTSEALERSPTFLFANYVFGSVASEAIHRSYSANDLTHDKVDKWLQFAANLRNDAAVQRISDHGEFYIDSSGGDEELSALALVTGERIIARSLVKIATTQPRSLIDSLYRVADTGLDPDHRLKRMATLTALKRALSDEPNVGVVLAYSVGANGHQAIQKKALDLQLTLIGFGMPSHLMYPATTINRNGILSMQTNDRKASRIVKALYPSVLCPNESQLAHGNVFSNQLKDWYNTWRADFLEFAGTPEGRASTLFGRNFDPADVKFAKLTLPMAQSDLSLQHLLPKQSPLAYRSFEDLTNPKNLEL